MAYRILADHIRTLSLAIADGALPSNEGRGYVLRRILRRAIKYGRHTLSRNNDAATSSSSSSSSSSCSTSDGSNSTADALFAQLVPILVKQMGTTYPELVVSQQKIIDILTEEEQSFAALLAKGVKHVEQLTSDSVTVTGKGKELSGEAAFFLYGTMGFPIDLTQLLAAERGWTVDTVGFQRELEAERTRARGARRKADAGQEVSLKLQPHDISALRNHGVALTDDATKYDHAPNLPCAVSAMLLPESDGSGSVLVLPSSKGKHDLTGQLLSTGVIGIVLDRSPFYAEAGGQISDTGTITISSGSETCALRVYDVQVLRPIAWLQKHFHDCNIA
jgi:alanyl-tRNA synthetase